MSNPVGYGSQKNKQNKVLISGQHEYRGYFSSLVRNQDARPLVKSERLPLFFVHLTLSKGLGVTLFIQFSHLSFIRGFHLFFR